MLAVAGLRIELQIAGGPLPAWLRAHERPGRGDLSLELDLRAGPIRDQVPLTMCGPQVRGDGLEGALGDRAGSLVVRGGDAALRSALRLVSAVWGAPRGTVLLHGACALLGSVETGGDQSSGKQGSGKQSSGDPSSGNQSGAAHLFVGESGAGKTTLSRLLETQGAQIISDEVSAVCPARGLVFGHPFRTHLGSGLPHEAPLGGVWLLEHGRLVEASAVSPAHAARALLPRVFQPLRDPATVAATLRAVDALSRCVPARRFAFPPTEAAARALLGMAA